MVTATPRPPAAASVASTSRADQLTRGQRQAATDVYAAELQLHCARQSGRDDWVRAAADKLHEALVELKRADGIAGRPWRSPRTRG